MVKSEVLRLPAGHFLGQKLRTHEVSGLRMTETLYPKGMRQAQHAHELSLYCFVLEGNYIETVGERERRRRPLGLAFHPPSSCHAESYTSPGRHFLIELNSDWMQCVHQYGAVIDRQLELQEGTPVWLAAKLYQEFRSLDNVSPLAVEGVVLELLAETSRRTVPSEKQAPRWLAEVTELLRAHFTENLNLKQVAAAVNVHPTHLARVFRKFKRCTIGEYLRRLRVDYASKRISDSADSLAEIALAAGFSDQSHLSRTFKSHTGMLPSEFRTAVRKR